MIPHFTSFQPTVQINDFHVSTFMYFIYLESLVRQSEGSTLETSAFQSRPSWTRLIKLNFPSFSLSPTQHHSFFRNHKFVLFTQAAFETFSKDDVNAKWKRHLIVYISEIMIIAPRSHSTMLTSQLHEEAASKQMSSTKDFLLRTQVVIQTTKAVVS